MATTKKTTTEKKTTTAKKPSTRKTAKPKLEVVKDEPVRELSVFEKMAASQPTYTSHIVLSDGSEVDVRNRIGFGEMIAIINRIVEACVDEEHGEINFEVYDYMTQMAICAVYCGIDAPADAEVGYLAVCRSGGMYEQVAGYIDAGQLEEIWRVTGQKLKAKSELFNSAAAKITVDMMQRVNELYEMMTNVTENFDGEEAVKALKQFSVLASGNNKE